MSTPAALADRLESALAGMADLRPAVASGHPWPLSDAFGEMTVAALAERFVVGHLEEHVRQLSEVLGAAGGSGPGASARA